jgi:hypothetical protein
MPILMCVVNTITDDENVRYCETNEINFNRHFPTARPVHQRACEDARGLFVLEEVARIKKSPPSINDIIDKQYSSAGQSSSNSPIRRTLPELSRPIP